MGDIAHLSISLAHLLQIIHDSPSFQNGQKCVFFALSLAVVCEGFHAIYRAPKNDRIVLISEALCQKIEHIFELSLKILTNCIHLAFISVG